MNKNKLTLLLITTLFSGTISAAGKDVSSGEKIFQQCAICHMVGKDAKNGIGPHLNNLSKRKIGELADYEYSEVFQEANSKGRTWNDKTMSEFLKSPLTYMAGTKMGFAGVQDEKDLVALIEYLKTL